MIEPKKAIVSVDLEKIIAIKLKRKDLEQKTASGLVDQLVQEELERARST